MTSSPRRHLWTHRLAATVAASCLIASLSAGASSELRLALVNMPDEPVTQAMHRFAELTEQYSEGNVTIQVSDGGHLGNDRELFNQLYSGAIDLGKPSFPILADVVPEYSVTMAGYFFDDWKRLEALLNAPEFGQQWRQRLLEDAGLRILAYYYFGTREVTMADQIPRTPEEFQGVKLRAVTNPMSLSVIRGLGASPTPIPFPELFQALNQGVADGQENPLPTIYANRLYEVQDSVILTHHQLVGQALVINDDSFQALSPADQQAMEQAAQEAMAYATQLAQEQEAQIVEALRDEGLTVVELSDAERDAFAASVRTQVLEDFDGRDWPEGFAQSVLDFADRP
ncbi:TRAP transporter substrate-binding protein [Halomonas sp. DP5Y7-2]|uniref:TRAP transporter substrate-binding protein n=1 Tax=Halomonas sp. DP5Y7-2 TaxID=2859076 RepID=UPI001C99204A|nr:TRAP transporter substrate-binding protein [Halomonas sp. DP5Y7-2]MBY5985598.1 TRAP transporter substrate-binding protein [Halomonas sp. DP5Y7-2]